MKKRKLNTVLIGVLIIILCIDIGIRIFEPQDANAGQKYSYRVLNTSQSKSAKQYESLLNKMASEGFYFQDTTAMGAYTIFRK